MALFPLYNPQRKRTYIARALLGEGGFGQVFDGHFGTLPVAIKIIKRTADFNRDWATWNHEQSVHLRCLGQTQIVQTYDQFVTQDGHLGS